MVMCEGDAWVLIMCKGWSVFVGVDVGGRLGEWATVFWYIERQTETDGTRDRDRIEETDTSR